MTTSAARHRALARRLTSSFAGRPEVPWHRAPDHHAPGHRVLGRQGVPDGRRGASRDIGWGARCDIGWGTHCDCGRGTDYDCDCGAGCDCGAACDGTCGAGGRDGAARDGACGRAGRTMISVPPGGRHGARRRTRGPVVTVTGLCVAALFALTGCGNEDGHGGSSEVRSGAGGSVPAGWGTLATKGVDVSYPKSGAVGYTAESAAERGKAAAAAVHTEDGVRLSTITVQLDFTKARSADEAAIGAEAGVQLGATLRGTKKVSLDGASDARRVDFDFTSSGRADTPPKGTRVHGVILTGLDSTKTTFAVRIDARKGLLSDATLKKIIDSVRVH